MPNTLKKPCCYLFIMRLKNYSSVTRGESESGSDQMQQKARVGLLLVYRACLPLKNRFWCFFSGLFVFSIFILWVLEFLRARFLAISPAVCLNNKTRPWHADRLPWVVATLDTTFRGRCALWVRKWCRDVMCQRVVQIVHGQIAVSDRPTDEFLDFSRLGMRWVSCICCNRHGHWGCAFFLLSPAI